MSRIRITTGSRLHFGLFGWGEHSPRQFGSLGLMVEEPGIRMDAEVADIPSASGRHADRARAILLDIPDRFRDTTGQRLINTARLEILAAPPEHVGLGLGTQLSLAVTRALLKLNEMREAGVDPLMLARLAGRGRRSGIGIHGFLQGGLLVDGGHRSGADGETPPLLARHHFPEDWHILLVRPPHQGIHGMVERQAFARLPPVPEWLTNRLCRLVLLDLLPCLLERNLDGFGEALSELQRMVGECFAPVQGGVYSSPLGAEIIAMMTRLRLKGAGQSSWGPTLYAFSDADETTRNRLAEQLGRTFGLLGRRMTWTRALNRGASLERLPSWT